VVNFTPWPLDPRQRNPARTAQGAEYAPDQMWASWRREKSLAPTEIRTPDHPSSNYKNIYSRIGHNFKFCQSRNNSKSKIKYEEDVTLFSFVMISETVALQMTAQPTEIREKPPRRECI